MRKLKCLCGKCPTCQAREWARKHKKQAREYNKKWYSKHRNYVKLRDKVIKKRITFYTKISSGMRLSEAIIYNNATGNICVSTRFQAYKIKTKPERIDDDGNYWYRSVHA